MDAEDLIQQLEQHVAEGRPVPLSSSVMVNRREVEEILNELRDRLPDEMRQARWIIKERDDLLAQAAREAEALMGDTQAERERLLSDQELTRAANREAERILSDAREQARVLRLEAEDYADSKLANFEIVLQRTLSAVEKGRERLRGASPADDLPVEDADETELDDPEASQFYDYEDDGRR